MIRAVADELALRSRRARRMLGWVTVGYLLYMGTALAVGVWPASFGLNPDEWWGLFFLLGVVPGLPIMLALGLAAYVTAIKPDGDRRRAREEPWESCFDQQNSGHR